MERQLLFRSRWDYEWLVSVQLIQFPLFVVVLQHICLGEQRKHLNFKSSNPSVIHSFDFDNMAIVDMKGNYHKRLFLEAWYSNKDKRSRTIVSRSLTFIRVFFVIFRKVFGQRPKRLSFLKFNKSDQCVDLVFHLFRTAKIQVNTSTDT